ncbi:MAG: hypothetical protein HOE90_15700 [Bacteriovoracaceae bacterium]|nr:hypothetical protein [Bacteriovoracaceae bacterium]
MTGKQPNETKVLLSLTGGMDSTVVAYLLNKQGYKCIGVSIVFLDDKFESFFTPSFFKPRSYQNLENLQTFCQKIGIPFYGIQASREYFDCIIEPMVAARLAGESYPLRYAENKLIMKILAEKSEKLETDLIATGHYAKIHRNLVKNEFALLTANDIKSDQSYFLCQTDASLFKKLLFPLGDLRKTEVEKLLKSFGQKIEIYSGETESIFLEGKELEFFKSQSPPDLRESGTIHTEGGGAVIGDHQGVIEYEIGQENLSTENFFGMVDKENVVVEINSMDRKIVIGPPDEFFFDCCSIVNVFFVKEIDKTKPIEVFIHHMADQEEREMCTLYFKNNNCAYLVFKKPIYSITIGKVIVFYNKSGGASHLIGSGVVYDNGDFSPINRVEKYDEPEYDTEGKVVRTPPKEFKF